jgi:hypothetical protein
MPISFHVDVEAQASIRGLVEVSVKANDIPG